MDEGAGAVPSSIVSDLVGVILAMPIGRVHFSKPLAAIAAALVLGVCQAEAASAGLPTLYVTYSLNCTFTLTDDSGRSVSSIAPGTYQVEVNTPTPFASVELNGVTDMTACQGSPLFQLSGPGVSLSTSLEDGDGNFALLSATFLPGSTYVAQDNNQPSVARVSFSTLATGSPSAPATPSEPGAGTSSSSSGAAAGSSSSALGTPIPGAGAPTALLGTLAGSVATNGSVRLAFKGKAVASLTAGRYTLVVSDASTKSGFILQAMSRPAIVVSSAASVGRRSLSVTLTPGQWFFYPTILGKKTYFIVIR